MYLLDTNHCSLILLNNSRVSQRIQEVGEANIATTIITAGELIYMAENSTYREENLSRIYQFIEDIRVYYIDENTARIYGKIKATIIKQFGPKQKTKRKTTQTTELGFDENDLWIAAIALHYQLTLVSADTDFPRIKTVIDFPIENWRETYP
jgi:tRNA(fMet)-specific endonuclease VapC